VNKVEEAKENLGTANRLYRLEVNLGAFSYKETNEPFNNL